MHGSSGSFEKISKGGKRNRRDFDSEDVPHGKYEVPKRGRGGRGQSPHSKAFVFNGFIPEVASSVPEPELVPADTASESIPEGVDADEEKDREIAELLRATIEQKEKEEQVLSSDVDDSGAFNPYIRPQSRRRAQEEMDALRPNAQEFDIQKNSRATQNEVMTPEEADQILKDYFEEPIDPDELALAQEKHPEFFTEDEDKKVEEIPSEGSNELENAPVAVRSNHTHAHKESPRKKDAPHGAVLIEDGVVLDDIDGSSLRRYVNNLRKLEGAHRERKKEEPKNWQELKMDGKEELPQVRNEAFRGAQKEEERAFETLLASRGWSKAVDAARTMLLEEGFVKGVLDKELVAFIQGLEGKKLDTIDDWPRELLRALEEVGFTIGAYDEFANTFEVATTRADVTLRAAFTPRKAVGFLKTMLGLPEHARYPYEVEEAFDDFALPTSPENIHYKPENIEKVQRAAEVLRKHEIIRDPNWVFDERFHTELGIYEKDLRAMEGFKELTLPQQKLLFENILEYQATHPESVSGRIWGKIEKTFSADRHTEKESEKLKSLVAGLVRNMAEYGPRVHETKEGVLIPDVVGLEYHRDHRKEQREASNALNKAAYELTQTPDSWRRIDLVADESANAQKGFFGKMKSFVSHAFNTDREKKEALYTAREAAYNEAKNTFAEAMRKSGMGESAVIKMLLQIDGKVSTLQFAQTAPEALVALEESGDSRATAEIARSFNVKEALAYAGLGAVSKLALKQTFDWATGPAVASVIGGIKSWRATRKELARRDRAARFGEVDASKEALNVAQAVQEVEVNGEKRDRGLIAKTQSLIDRIHALHGTAGEESVAERARLLEQLKIRVAYVEEKMRLNRINFGKPREVPNTIARLYETLGEAHVLLADRVDPALSITEMRLQEIKSLVEERDVTLEKIATAAQKGQEEVRRVEERTARRDARRASYFKNKDVRREKVRTWYKTKEASKGAAKAGAFALLGAGLVELFEYDRQVAEATANGTLDALKRSVKEALDARDNINIDTPIVAPEMANASISPEATEFGEFLDGADEVVSPESAGEALVPQVYEIQRGDTLTSILKEQIPAIKDLGPGQTQETAITNFLNSLTPAERTTIGIGASVDKIFAGESLNLQALGELIEKKGIIKS